MVIAALALVIYPLLRREAAAGREKSATRAVPAAVVMMVALPLAASAFYGATSNYPWDDAAALAAGGGGHAQGGASMEEATRQLEARLEQNPGDVEGWRMLGRTYLVTGRPGEAAAAYEKAIALTDGADLTLQVDLAEALVLTQEPQVQQRAGQIIDAALAADENDQKALWYAGLMAARAGDNETAKLRWSRLLEMNPPEEIRQILLAQLAELGVAPPQAPEASAAGSAGDSAPSGEGAAGRTIRVAVSVDPSLAGQLRPGSVVFVSAREAGIPGPPLAAVRMSSDELPTTVVLSDANAMVEGRNLSSVDEVQLVARVAFGGTAVTSPGDLVGEGRHRKGTPADVAVVIDKVAP